RAALAQTKLLTRLRTRRDAQLRLAFNRRHFNLRAQRAFRHGYRNSDVNIVALASEVFVRADIRYHIQIPRRRAESPAFALRGNANPRTCFHAGGNANFYRFRFWHRALALAQGARRSPAASATAVGTLLRETQTPTGSLYLSRT